MSESPHVWEPPPSVRAAGERARVRYQFAAATAPGEQRSPSATLVALRDVLVHGVRGITSGGLVRDAARRANASHDAHRAGIACDLMIRDDATRAAVGDAVANWLVLNAETLGVQYVLWSMFEWSASSSGARWERYTGENPHRDHVHFELGPEGIALGATEMTARASRLLYGAGSSLLAWLMGAALAVAGAVVLGPRIAARWGA